MLIHTVSQYLKSHKRLVIPQLGTFIVKEPGRSVVFTELLKRDDGVLRQLLRDEGTNELEAAGEIDRFVFEIRHAVQHGGTYRLEGFGAMGPGPNDTIAFVYEPSQEASPTGSEPAAAAPRDGESAGNSSVSRPALQPGKIAEAVKAAFAEPKVSSSPKMTPDPSVRGLRYGTPPKNTDAYTFVDKAPRRHADRFIWIAVLAAAIAVAAIAFGYFREAHDRKLEAEYFEQTELQPTSAEAPAAAEKRAPAKTPVAAKKNVSKKTTDKK